MKRSALAIGILSLAALAVIGMTRPDFSLWQLVEARLVEYRGDDYVCFTNAYGLDCIDREEEGEGSEEEEGGEGSEEEGGSGEEEFEEELDGEGGESEGCNTPENQVEGNEANCDVEEDGEEAEFASEELEQEESEISGDSEEEQSNEEEGRTEGEEGESEEAMSEEAEFDAEEAPSSSP